MELVTATWRRFVILPAVTVCDGSRSHPCEITHHSRLGWRTITCRASGCGWTGIAASQEQAEEDARLHNHLQPWLEGGWPHGERDPEEGLTELLAEALLSFMTPHDIQPRDVTGRLIRWDSDLEDWVPVDSEETVSF